MITVCCLVFLDEKSSTSDNSVARGVIDVMYSARVFIFGTIEEIILSASGAYVEIVVIIGTVGAIIFAAEGTSAEKGVVSGISAAREVVVGMVGSIGGSGWYSGMVNLAVVADGVARYPIIFVVGLYAICSVVSSPVKGPSLTYFEWNILFSSHHHLYCTRQVFQVVTSDLPFIYS